MCTLDCTIPVFIVIAFFRIVVYKFEEKSTEELSNCLLHCACHALCLSDVNENSTRKQGARSRFFVSQSHVCLILLLSHNKPHFDCMVSFACSVLFTFGMGRTDTELYWLILESKWDSPYLLLQWDAKERLFLITYRLCMDGKRRKKTSIGKLQICSRKSLLLFTDLPQTC